jgi:hypothetical protein
MTDRKTTLRAAELVSAEVRHDAGYISRVSWDGEAYGEAAFQNLIRSAVTPDNSSI